MLYRMLLYIIHIQINCIKVTKIQSRKGTASSARLGGDAAMSPDNPFFVLQDVDCFQIWEILKNYLCHISCGTPANALNNTSQYDTRPSILLPNVWIFYHSERMFLLKLLQYIFQFKDETNHKHHEQFYTIINEIGIPEMKTSLLSQFEKLLITAPPPRKIQNDFQSDSMLQEWAESNLREQLAILQILLQIAEQTPFKEAEFTQMFSLFKKHGFGKSNGYNDLLDERHKEACTRIMCMEVCIFMVVVDSKKM